MNVLVIGGTRHIGYFLVHRLLESGHHVTVLNRGITANDLPPQVERLRADREVAEQMTYALAKREFDAVVDLVLYEGHEAEHIVNLLQNHTAHYLFISTGQVYLVRGSSLARPFKEGDYNGEVMPAPPLHSADYSEWVYGYEKRQAEDVLAQAWQTQQFPYTSLRLPMVNGERDHFHRLYSYILRLQDGEPILIPDQPNYRLNHIYVADVVRVLVQLIESGAGKGQVFNIAQDEAVPLETFLAILADYLGVVLRLQTVDRATLEKHSFLPHCSPFSERWMSELDNQRSKDVLGVHYTPLATYLENLVRHYTAHPVVPTPMNYSRRATEIAFAHSLPAG